MDVTAGRMADPKTISPNYGIGLPAMGWTLLRRTIYGNANYPGTCMRHEPLSVIAAGLLLVGLLALGLILLGRHRRKKRNRWRRYFKQ